MARRPVRIWPDPVLSRRTREVSDITASIRQLVADMFDTMYAENGIGLAANQIGASERIAIVDLDPKRQAPTDPELAAELAEWGFVEPVVLINPKIVEASGSVTWEEGCLSVPGVLDNVRRRKRIRLQATDLEGKPFELRADGLFAVAMQHELDHLNGKVFVEYLPKLKLGSIRSKMQRLKSAGKQPKPIASAESADLNRSATPSI
jgi:peptide deformylase